MGDHVCDPADVAELVILQSTGWAIPEGDHDLVYVGAYFDPIARLQTSTICTTCGVESR